MLGTPVPGTTPNSCDKSAENPNISPKIPPNIPDTETLVKIDVFCRRSSSFTQITKMCDYEVRAVSEGGGKALSSEYYLGRSTKL